MTQVFTGSKGSFKLNGQKVAFVGSVTINQEHTLTDVDVLDQLEVAELAETAIKCNFSVNLFKVDANAAKALGLDPDNLDDILTQPELTMEMYDRIGDKVIYTATGVKFEGGSGSLDARGIWQGTWNFRARRGQGI